MRATNSGPPASPASPLDARTARARTTGTTASAARPARLRRRPKISSSSDRRKRAFGRRAAGFRIGGEAVLTADIEPLPGQRHERLLQVGRDDAEAAHPDAVVYEPGHDLLR